MSSPYAFVLLSLIIQQSSQSSLQSQRTRFKRSQEACKVQTIEVNGPGELSSPNYPKNYPSNAACRWNLASPPGSQIKMVIDNLEVEEAQDCLYDFLEISGLKIGSSMANETKYCGVLKDRTLVTFGNKATIKFVSDASYEERGFFMKYSILSDKINKACNETLTKLAGTITTPGYPDNYPDNVDCWSKIQVEAGLHVKLKFKSLMLEHTEGQRCKYDYIRVYDGDEKSALIRELCEDPPTSEIFSTGNELTINFRSDEFLNSKGFVAEYHAVKDTVQVRTPQAGDCIWDIGSKNGTIASPNYPKKYPSNAKCVISLVAPMNNVVKFQFTSISTEQMSDSSVYDFVRLYDGATTNSSVLGTYAGTSAPKEPITSSSSSLTVEFGSDGFMEFSGFRAVYEFVGGATSNMTTTTTTTVKPFIPDENNQGAVDELLSEVPYDTSVIVGESYIMKCTPKNKSTTITWWKGQTMVGSKHIEGLRILDDFSLSIDKMNEHLEGSYTCIALGTNGKTASVTALIFSHEKTKNIENCQLTFISKPENKTLLVGEFTFLGCYMDGASITWKHNGDRVKSSSDGRILVLHNGHLSINNVQEQDSGVYTCTILHSDTGCVRSVSAVVQVIKPANVQSVCGKPRMNDPVTDKPRVEHGKIVNGLAAKKGAYPWMVMLYTEKLGAYCGASLINERWLISAAHCFTRHAIPLPDIQVKLGKTDKYIREESERVLEVEDVITHPLFDPSTYDNDIALIKLKTHITFTNFILPICLGTSSFQQSRFFNRGPQMGTATGWGSKWHKGPKARVLLEVVLPIVDQSICKVSTKYTVTSNMFCAGYALAGAGDTCKGDSGGPFGMKNEDQWYLIGITSWGEKCSLADKYGYYTKISNYITWIHNTIKI